MTPRPRTADPYLDLAVIDRRAPRFNQAVVGLLAVIATVTGFWPLLTLLAVQLAVGLTFGRKYCLPCAAYFTWVQPRFGEGPLEDARMPKFANQIGVAVLTAATLCHLVGWSTAGWWLGLMVAVLASLAAITGLCVGCELYRIGARLRGVKQKVIEHLDVGVAFVDGTIVHFTHPLCSDCQTLEKDFVGRGKTLVKVDVSKHPELARKYGIAVVPTAFEVRSTGEILARLA